MTTPPSPRTRVRRRPARGDYDRATIDAILDEALTCTVAFVRQGWPVAIPTIHARHGDVLYLHGSTAAGFVRDLADGRPVCVTVSIIDGLVLARSANHHSMNYRSVVVYGTATPVTDPDEKLRGLQAVVDHVMPGRWPSLRPVTDAELRETTLLSVGLEEASAKVRTGPSIEPDEDRCLPIWAGLLPLRLSPGEPITDDAVPGGVTVPDHVRRYPHKPDR